MTAPDPKAPKRTAPPDVRKKQLIEATITCIADKGISGTTLNAVTKEAGLSLGLANFHFKSKDVLLTETLAFLAKEHRSLWIEDASNDLLSPAEKLETIVNAQFDKRVCGRKKLAVWFAFFGEAKYRKSYRDTALAVDTERLDASTAICALIIGESGYSRVSARGVAQTLEGLFDGLWLNMLMNPTEFSRDAAKAQVITYLSGVFPDHFSAKVER